MINGVINVYKETGFTSHDVVAKLRGILKQKKIGHMGTLDPNAVGVLPVCLGKATKLCDILSEKNKTYKATLLLGTMTKTQDIYGKVISEASEEELNALDEEEVIRVINSYEGDYEQIPPMFSAIKIQGQKLYDLARRGEEVERPARHCKILDIRILGFEFPRVFIQVTCSKGTYIRTLCHDIGNDLGVGGCMENLTRTQVDRFNVSDAVTLADIEKARDEGNLDKIITPIDDILSSYSKCVVSEDADKLVMNGNIFTAGDTKFKMNHEDGQIVRVYKEDDTFIGLYKYFAGKRIYKPEKMFI